MKFSLVITTYNRLELLKRAIACGLNQTVPCEVVVADDASTDGTEEYVRRSVVILSPVLQAITPAISALVTGVAFGSH